MKRVGRMALLALACAPAAWPQTPPLPLGPQFQVNTYTSGDQARPSVAVAADGSFVVVWDSYAEPGIRGRLFDRWGQPLGEDRPLSNGPPGDDRAPRVGMSAGGAFVVAWQGNTVENGDDTDRGIEARRFDALGLPLGGAFQVNSYTTNHQGLPAIAVRPDGSFVVAWNSAGSSTSSSWSLQAQRFDAQGVPQEGQFEVTPYEFYDWPSASITSRADGTFELAWGDLDYWARRYAAAGNPLGGEFQVNEEGWSIEYFDTGIAARPDGGFIVVWAAIHAPDPHETVRARAYDAQGIPLSPPFAVSTSIQNPQLDPDVGCDDSGSCFVAWENRNWGIQGRRLDSAGNPIGPELTVNSITSYQYPNHPAVAVEPDGDFVVAWTSAVTTGNDTEGWSIQARRFSVNWLFLDGFESGNTAAWSTTVP